MPLTPDEEAELQALTYKTYAQERGIDKEPGVETPMIDPLDFVPVARGASAAKQGIKGIADWAGISSIPGRLMASGVGAKYTPQVGNQLVKEGLIGTRGMVQGQVQKGLAKHGAALDSAVAKIPGTIDSAPVAGKVGSLTKKYSTSDGYVPAEVMPEFTKITGTAADISGRGQVSPQKALELKRIAGGIGYNKDKPLASLTAKTAQAESAGYGQALEEAYGAANKGPNVVAESNAGLHALMKAKRGLDKEPTLASMNPANMWRSLPGGTLAQTTAAHVVDKAGRGATNVASGLGAFVTQKGINSAAEPSASWTAEDEAELQALQAKMR